MSVGAGYIKNLVVFNRRLGCTDESATDEEQAEKILYYYPEDASLYSQLSRMTMIESLIEFSAKFSTDPIDIVLMEGMQWGFYECEPDIWIVIALDTQISAIEQGESTFYYKHSPNGEGLVQAIQKMYLMYNTLFGSIGVMLRHGHEFSSSSHDKQTVNDESSEGWRRIRQVATLRKLARKLRQKCRQIDQDIEVMTEHEDEARSRAQANKQNDQEQHQHDNNDEYEENNNSDPKNNSDSIRQDDSELLEFESTTPEVEEEEDRGRDSEHLGIRSGTSTLAELVASRDATLADIATKEYELEETIGPIPEGESFPIRTCTYTPLLASYIVTTFSKWYLASGEFLSPSGLSGMWGMHFSAIGNPSFYAVERMRSAVRATMTAIIPPCQATCGSSPEGVRGIDVCGGLPTEAKCLILYEGQVIWNDFFDHDVMHLYEYLRLHQSNSLRETAELIKNVSSVSSPPSLSPDETSRTRSASRNDEKPNAIQKFQTFSRRFSTSRSGSSSSSASKLQKKNTEDLIDSYTTSYKNRKGFLTRGWNTVDMLSGGPPSEINNSGHEGEALMSYYCESFRETDTSAQVNDDNATPRGGSVWCPRLFSPVRMMSNIASEDSPTETIMIKPEAEYDGGLEETEVEVAVLQESQQSLCLGRAVVYQQDGYLVAVVLPDWTSAEDFCRNLSGKVHVSETEMSQIDIFNFCKLLQLNVSAAISSTQEEELLGPQYLPSPSSMQSMDLPGGVSFVCCNNLNVAFKAVNVYRNAASPLLAWPKPLAPGCDAILSLLQNEPQCFPLSSGQLVGSFQPKVVAAINDVRASVSGRKDSPMGGLQEACIRVTSAFRGGIWVLGRSLGDRHIVFVLEGCSTLNEVHDVVNKVMTSFLGNILL